MKLFQVRKGQFVYYRNELHKVYSVKPVFKKSVHMYRVKDMNQVLTRAEEIQLYRPRHLDSFIFYGKRYTLHEDKQPEKNDYILITKPTPVFLDHYSLNEFEKVDRVEKENVVTTRDNSIKPSEFVVMVPGEDPNSQDIAYYDKSLVSDSQLEEDNNLPLTDSLEMSVSPSIGDIYLDAETMMQTMIVAMDEEEVVFGHGDRVSLKDLSNSKKWRLLFNARDDVY